MTEENGPMNRQCHQSIGKGSQYDSILQRIRIEGIMMFIWIDFITALSLVNFKNRVRISLLCLTS